MLSTRLLLVLMLGALTPACADPAAAFDDFVARRPPPPPAGECPDAFASPAVGDMDGDYLMMLLTPVNLTKPLAVFATVTTEDLGGELGMGMTLQGLDKTDWRTPVGGVLTVPAVPIGRTDGSFTIAVTGLEIVAEANCLAALDVSADITFEGNVCGDGSFICGTAAGVAHAGALEPDLTGTTWTLQRITNPAEFPEPLLDCKQTLYTDMQCGPGSM